MRRHIYQVICFGLLVLMAGCSYRGRPSSRVASSLNSPRVGVVDGVPGTVHMQGDGGGMGYRTGTGRWSGETAPAVTRVSQMPMDAVRPRRIVGYETVNGPTTRPGAGVEPSFHAYGSQPPVLPAAMTQGVMNPGNSGNRGAEMVVNRSGFSSLPTDREGRPHRRNIGVYGELVTGPEAGQRVGDGGKNMMQITFQTEGASFDPDVSPDGRQIVFASTMHRETADLYVKSAMGKTVTQLTTDPAEDVMPSISPTGQEIAFASNRSGNWDVYVMPMEGGPAVQLTSDSDHELHPTWSPDGSRLVYCKFGTQSGRWEIWTVDLTMPGVKQFLEYGVFPVWSPDLASGKILFQRARQRGSRFHSIWTIDYAGGEASQLTEIVSAANAAVINPAWSPDGRRIVFVTVIEPDAQPGDHPTESDVWVVNVDGTNRTKLTASEFANYQPVWSIDGTVYFISDRSGVDNIWAVTTGRMLKATGEAPRSASGSVDDMRD